MEKKKMSQEEMKTQYSGELSKWMCPECSQGYNDPITAEACHKKFPIKVSGKIPIMKTVKYEVRREEKDNFYYMNECQNLRDVPQRAKIWAEWEMPVDENY
jgi:hypothetical protein